MGNLDFSADPKFAWYVIFLAISGVVLIALGPLVGSSQKASSRILTAVLGLGFLGYAIYLAFIFEGGTYTIFFYAFILPVVIAFKFIGGMIAARQARSAPTQTMAPQPIIPPTANAAVPAPEASVETPSAPTPPPVNPPAS